MAGYTNYCYSSWNHSKLSILPAIMHIIATQCLRHRGYIRFFKTNNGYENIFTTIQSDSNVLVSQNLAISNSGNLPSHANPAFLKFVNI